MLLGNGHDIPHNRRPESKSKRMTAELVSSRTKILVVASTRPNFVKVAPLMEAFQRSRENYNGVNARLVHTGQHYDDHMSRWFFRDLGLPPPDIELAVGSGSHAEQTARAMIVFERTVIDEQPDCVIVVGDVNSTLACALVAKKLGVKVAHVEAGLRSRDWTMPEELNRVVTDVLSDLLFTTDRAADANLRAEGIDSARIHFVGNVMIDTLLKHKERASALEFWKDLGLESKRYAVVTLHRPSNVDDRESFTGICLALKAIQEQLPIVFPIHPRTRKMATAFGLLDSMLECPALRILEPLSYLQMLSLTSNAKLILCDSGGLQEEALILGVPCLTLRDNTERPITVEMGGNRIVGNKPDAILAAVHSQSSASSSPIRRPEKWDGAAAERIVNIVLQES
jgi:UDP-N-acetylglucosamine 2-epimerase (non-hydrolysing)